MMARPQAVVSCLMFPLVLGWVQCCALLLLVHDGNTPHAAWWQPASFLLRSCGIRATCLARRLQQ